MRLPPVWSPAGLGCGKSLLKRTPVHCHNALAEHRTLERTADIEILDATKIDKKLVEKWKRKRKRRMETQG